MEDNIVKLLGRGLGRMERSEPRSDDLLFLFIFIARAVLNATTVYYCGVMKVGGYD